MKLNTSEGKPKFAMYARVGNFEQLDNLEFKYYKFIQHYEEFLNKYRKVDNSNNDIEKRSPMYSEISKVFNESYEKEYYPWRFIEGNVLLELQRIFKSKSNEIMPYLKVEDLIFDDFYSMAEEELKKYYKDNNIEKSEDDLINEIIDFKFDRKFKRKVFSKETRTLYSLYKELSPIADELLKNKNKIEYFYNLMDDTPVTTEDILNWYENNSKDATSYESNFNTFDEYFNSLFGLDSNLIPISKEEYKGLLNDTHEFNSATRSVFEKELTEDLEEIEM